MQTNTYKIFAGPSGIDCGAYHGRTEAAALDAYASAQGYSSFASMADALELTPEQARAELRIVPVTHEEKADIAHAFGVALSGELRGRSNAGLRSQLRDVAQRWVENRDVPATAKSLRAAVELACRSIALQPSGKTAVDEALEAAADHEAGEFDGRPGLVGSR